MQRTRRQLSTANEVRTLYWGGGEMEEQETQMREDYDRLKATV